MLEQIRSLLHDYFGARADVRVAPMTGYGETAATLAGGDKVPDPVDAGGRSCRVILFNLAQSPEAEVHGEFLESAKVHATDRGAELLVMVDPAPYRARMESGDRVSERLRAWRRVVREAGLDLVSFDLDRGADHLLEQVVPALWTPESAPS